jgi:hypothetical protein
MKGFGTDEKALIRILATKDPLQINTIRDAYSRLHRRDLIADIKSETSGWLETGLVALARGPLLNDVYLLREAMSGMGTKEKALNDVLLGRTNADMNAIKSEYHRVFHRRLEDDVRGDLSMKTERHFMIVLGAQRAEDSAPVVKADVDRDANDLYNATEGKIGTDEMKVCSILSTRNDNQIRAIAYEYQQKFARNLEDVIRRVSSAPPRGSWRAGKEANGVVRNSRATWRTRCSSSSATPSTSTCTRPRCWRMPWLAPAPRITFWLAVLCGTVCFSPTFSLSRQEERLADNLALLRLGPQPHGQRPRGV